MSRLSRTMKAKIRKHGVQKKEIGGLISQAWGMLDEIGAAGKADYAETDKYGALKNPTKNTVGGIVGAVLDPAAFITDLINGESFIGAKSRGEKLARQNKLKEVADNAKIQNQAGAAADQFQMKKNEIRLAKGGTVRRKHATGGIVKRMKNKPEAFKPKAKMIGTGIEGWLQGKYAGGFVGEDEKSKSDSTVKRTIRYKRISKEQVQAGDSVGQKELKSTGKWKEIKASEAKPGDSIGPKIWTKRTVTVPAKPSAPTKTEEPKKSEAAKSTPAKVTTTPGTSKSKPVQSKSVSGTTPAAKRKHLPTKSNTHPTVVRTGPTKNVEPKKENNSDEAKKDTTPTTRVDSSYTQKAYRKEPTYVQKSFRPKPAPQRTKEEQEKFMKSLNKVARKIRRKSRTSTNERISGGGPSKLECLTPSKDGYDGVAPAGSTGSVVKKAKGGVVTGKPGIDTNLATLKEGSFVIPTSALKGEQGKIVRQAMKKFGYDKPLQKEKGGDVPVLLTEREYVIEPHKKSRVAAYLKTKGIPSLESLAPNAEDGNAKNAGGNVKRYQELQMKSMRGINLTEDEQSELKRLGETIKTEKNNEVVQKKADDANAKAAVDQKMKSTVDQSTGVNASKLLKDMKPYITSGNGSGSGSQTGKKKSGTATDMMAGGIQTGVGMIGMATMGKDPLVKADQEGLFEDRFIPAVTIDALARIQKQASFGMDPRTKEVLMQGTNDQYAQETGMAREGSGSSAELFNRRSSSGLNKLRAMNDIIMKDSELKNNKQLAAANAGFEADKMFANRYDANKALKIRKTELQHGEWQKEAENWGSLINSGMATMTEAPRINRFYSDMMEYSNAYGGA